MKKTIMNFFLSRHVHALICSFKSMVAQIQSILKPGMKSILFYFLWSAWVLSGCATETISDAEIEKSPVLTPGKLCYRIISDEDDLINEWGVERFRNFFKQSVESNPLVNYPECPDKVAVGQHVLNILYKENNIMIMQFYSWKRSFRNAFRGSKSLSGLNTNSVARSDMNVIGRIQSEILLSSGNGRQFHLAMDFVTDYKKSSESPDFEVESISDLRKRVAHYHVNIVKNILTETTGSIEGKWIDVSSTEEGLDIIDHHDGYFDGYRINLKNGIDSENERDFLVERKDEARVYTQKDGSIETSINYQLFSGRSDIESEFTKRRARITISRFNNLIKVRIQAKGGIHKEYYYIREYLQAPWSVDRPLKPPYNVPIEMEPEMDYGHKIGK